MGTTEFLTSLKTKPERAHHLLTIITGFLVDWVTLQRETFPSIDGILLLDDIVGFISGKDFRKFGLPYLKQVYDADVSVKFFHNDAPCKASAPDLAEAGVNLLNFGVQHTTSQMREWTGGGITLVGNLPPRDVLANGTSVDVEAAVRAQLEADPVRSRLIVSCGGGMPPGVPTENVRALVRATNELTS